VVEVNKVIDDVVADAKVVDFTVAIKLDFGSVVATSVVHLRVVVASHCPHKIGHRSIISGLNIGSVQKRATAIFAHNGSSVHR
jgi:hypothetical protein